MNLRREFERKTGKPSYIGLVGRKTPNRKFVKWLQKEVWWLRRTKEELRLENEMLREKLRKQ